MQLDPWFVGCGYAAREVQPANVFVVRRSDGWSWLVPDTAIQKIWTPIGLACEHVHAPGQIDGKTTLARVRLDSLGPGMPPD